MHKGLMVGIGVLGCAVLTVVGLAQTSKMPQFPKDNAFAPFINTQNFAAEQGATAEWRKMEGVAVNASTRALYYAVTAVAKGMSDTKGDMQLKENKCGAVYLGQMDENFNNSVLTPVVVGGPFDEKNKDYPCNPDAISNPDNIFVDSKNNLWIGEDTDFHKNQFLWVWNGKTLKRFASMPAGAEVTGLRIEPDGTIFLNVQHPAGSNIYPFNRATVGVITGFKAGDDFKAVGVPTGDATKRLTIAAGQYQVLGRTGDAIPNADAIYGQINKADGTMMNVCNNPDGNMFLPTATDGSEGYLYTNWECSPGGVSKVYIKRTESKWSSLEGESVDLLAAGGTQNNCNASVTPWGSALTSEEYPPDVEAEWGSWQDTLKATEMYLGAKPNPYAVGYPIEMIPGGGEDNGLNTIATKHYAMGRQSWEMALVMPDHKTVYSGNDGSDRVMLKFVADKAGDLSAGTVYAAKVKQDGEKLNLSWLELGKGNDADVEKAIKALGATIN